MPLTYWATVLTCLHPVWFWWVPGSPWDSLGPLFPAQAWPQYSRLEKRPTQHPHSQSGPHIMFEYTRITLYWNLVVMCFMYLLYSMYCTVYMWREMFKKFYTWQMTDYFSFQDQRKTFSLDILQTFQHNISPIQHSHKTTSPCIISYNTMFILVKNIPLAFHRSLDFPPHFPHETSL